MKMKHIVAVLCLLFLLPITTVAFEEVKGEYDVVIPAFPPPAHSLDKVVMHEVLSFYCGHCYHLNQEIHELEELFGDKLEIIAQPTGWGGEEPGKLYFLAKKHGKGEAVKKMIFEYYFKKGHKKAVYTDKKLLLEIAKKNGLEKEFKKEMNSPEIIKKMKDSKRFAEEKQITGTPTLVIEDVIKANGDIENLKVVINSLLKNPVKYTPAKSRKHNH